MKQYIRKYFFVSIFYIIFPLLHNVQPLRAGFDMGNISEEDMIAMQQELQAQIDAMSDAERESFYQIMENVERMSQEDPAALERFITGSMTKEEEAEFVKAMVPETEVAPEAPIAPKEEAVKTVVKEPAKAEVLTEEQLSLQEKINTCITKTESFLVKMQSYPEINTRIRNWTKKNNLTTWPEGKQWKDVEFDINIFVQKLSVIKNEKNKNKKNTLIDAFSKNNALLTSLTSLNNALTTYEKDVDIAPFGITKIKKETKAAMQNLVNVFTSELYNMQINSQISEILKTYNTEDKKTREEEEALIKKAQQDREKSRPKEYMKSAGQAKNNPRGSASTYSSDYDSYVDGYRDSYDNYPSYHPSSYDSYEVDSPSLYDSSSGTSFSSGGPRGITSKRVASNYEDSQGFDDIDPKRDRETSPLTKTAVTSSTKKTSMPATRTTRKRMDVKDRLVDDMAECLEKVNAILSKEKKNVENKDTTLNETFFDLVTFMQTEQSLETLASVNNKITNIVRYITKSKGILDSLKALKTRLNKESIEVKTEYKAKVKELYTEFSPLLEKLSLQIKNVEDNWPDISKKVALSNTYALWDPAVAYKTETGKILPTSITAAGNNLQKELSHKDLFRGENGTISEQEGEFNINKDTTDLIVNNNNTEQNMTLVPINEKAKKTIEMIPHATTLKELGLALKTLKKEIEGFVK